MMFNILKRAVTRRNFPQGIEKFKENLALLLMVGQITGEQYEELMALLAEIKE